MRRGASARPAAIDSPYDFNRDGKVNAVDLAAVRINVGRALRPVTIPPPTAPAPRRDDPRIVDELTDREIDNLWVAGMDR